MESGINVLYAFFELLQMSVLKCKVQLNRLADFIICHILLSHFRIFPLSKSFPSQNCVPFPSLMTKKLGSLAHNFEAPCYTTRTRLV